MTLGAFSRKRDALTRTRRMVDLGSPDTLPAAAPSACSAGPSITNTLRTVAPPRRGFAGPESLPASAVAT